jgi:hypothetical protein
VYRRCHLSARSAQESMTVFNGFLFIALRLTFGGSACLNLWSCIAELTTDLCNMLIQNPAWNHKKLSDPLTKKIDKPKTEPPHIKFATAKKLSVELPENDIGKADLFIDDNIIVTLDKGDNYIRTCTAAILAIHTVARPLNSKDIIPRKEIISMKKFEAEAQPAETKAVLGWIINTRTLRIHLPWEKSTEWKTEIQKIISNPKTSMKQMESLIGRLDHVASIMDMLCHFMSRLRHALQRTRTTHFTTLTSHELNDLKLMQDFINIASTNGISLNNLTYRYPSHLYRSDASLHGLGGYNVTSGNAWRLELPIQCRLRTSLNSLEFIAALISIWIDDYYKELPKEACILSQTDSTSASGWLKKSNFSGSSENQVQLSTARKLASIILTSETCLYSQWFPGDENVVADACSRDFHLSDIELTELIFSFAPHQIPNGFKMRVVPQEITSWLTSLLLRQPQQQEWNQTPIQSKISHGEDILLTSNPLQSNQIHSWKISQHSNETRSLEPSHTHFEMEDFIQGDRTQSKPNQFDPPSIAWHRPTAWQISPIQELTKMENLLFFYNDKSEDIRN